ncbi:MAG: Gfo/Idh/MocA family protein [Candidatus Helarchaeota archaeon]
MKFVKYGIIGVGGAWAFHKGIFKTCQKMKLVSVYDINEKKANRVARGFKCDAYDNIEDFLNSDIDAVLIMVPHYLHEKYVIASAKAKKHVLCEKPMATTLEGCDRMIEITKRMGVKFMIAENHRFLPAHKYIKNALDKGLIGDIFLIRSYEGVYEVPGLMKKGYWKGHPIMAGGGSLMDMGAHKFATISWILNDNIESAYAWITKQIITIDEKAEDNAMAFIRFSHGTIAEVVVSFTVTSEITNSLEIYGTKGAILENHMWKNPVKIQSFHEDMGDKRGIWMEPEIEHGIFPRYYNISARIEDEYFTDCILKNKEPEFTPEQAKNAISTILMCYLSARTGKTITYSDLMKIYKTKGTKFILRGLEDYVQKNYQLK